MTFNRDVLFGSRSDKWETPKEIFDQLNEELGPFTLDVCADESNYKVENYYTKQVDGLSQDWGGNICWMNPPFSVEGIKKDGSKYRKRVIQLWVEKAFIESQKPNTRVVCLLPARTDTKWFHKYCSKGEIWFIKGRLNYNGRGPAPFPAMIVVLPPRGGKGV